MALVRTNKGACSLTQALNFVNSLAVQCELAVDQNSSPHVSKLGRRLLSLSNSVAIVLIQFDVLPSALEVLKLSVKADVQLFFKGRTQDRLWYRRALTYTLLGYLFQRMNDLNGSLKFLYDAEGLILELQQDFPNSPHYFDLSLTHSLVTFFVLFKAHKYEQANKYIKQAASYYHGVVNKTHVSQYNPASCNNFYCLLQIGIEALESLRRFNPKHTELKLIMEKLSDNQSAAVSLLEKAANTRTKMESSNVVLSDEYQSLMFITCCFRFISKSTPIISFKELNRVQEQAHRNRINKKNLHFTVAARRGRSTEDYTSVMKSALDGMYQIPN